MNRLLACVDASSYAESVCDTAAWAATRLSAGVDVLHVVGRREHSDFGAFGLAVGAETNMVLQEELARAEETNLRLAEARGSALLDASRQRIVRGAVEDVRVQQRSGSFVDAVVDMEPAYDLVVIGKRGSNADFARLHLGSNLERVVRASSRPILVASRAFRTIGRAVLAYDGGASADKALEAVAVSPLFAGIDIHVVCVGPVPADLAPLAEAATSRLAAAGRTATPHILAGDPEAEIAHFIRRDAVDLLVMGAYGHSRLRQLIVGSTTSTMIRTCLVPVLLFR